IGLAVVAVGEAMMVQGVPLALVWTSSAVALGVVARVLGERRLSVAAGGYLLIAAAHTLVDETPPSRLVHATLHPGAHLAALVLVVAATAAVAQLVQADDEAARATRTQEFWAAGVLGVYGLCLAILELAERVAPGDNVHTNF